MMEDYGEALNLYLESYSIAIKHLTSKEEMTVLNNIGILYIRDKKLDKAEEYLNKAFQIAIKNNDSIKAGYYLINLGAIAHDKKELQKARKHLEDAIYKLREQPEGLFMAQIVLAENDLLIGNTKAAITKAQALLQSMKEENADYLINLSTIIAKGYLKESDTDSALSWAKKAMQAQPDLEMKTELYELLADIYFKKKLHDLAFRYKDSVTGAYNALNAKKNSQLFESSAVKLEVQNYKREIASKDARILYERQFFYGIVIIAFLIIVFLLITFRNQRIKNRQNKLIAQRNQEIVEFKLQKEIDDNLLSKKKEEIAILEQERLKKEIEIKNQKISAKALYNSGRNQLLQEILKSLSAEPELSANKALIKHIRALKNHIKTEDDWDDFIVHFEEVNQGFLKKLKATHPQLTANDIRYISYVYMNLSTKEIATIFNITLEACKKRKMRIVEKLGITEDISLMAYLSGF